MAERDFYQVLGVSKTSTPAEIKKAYRSLALKFHPDKNKTKEAEDKFKEINHAYEVLSDPIKRQQYDQFGSTAFEGGRSGGGPFGGGSGRQQGPFTYTYTTGDPFGRTQGEQGFDFNFGGFSDPFEIFEQFFGGGSPFGRRKPAYSLTIEFMDAVKGTEKRVTIDGRPRTIRIPAGVNTGSRIRFDEFDIVVNIKPHTKFAREGYDIITENEIDIVQAALGAIVEIETVEGKVKLKIPEGTQPGALIRIKGKGVPFLQGKGVGDHYVKIKVTIPRKLKPKQKDLLEEFEKEGKKGWF